MVFKGRFFSSSKKSDSSDGSNNSPRTPTLDSSPTARSEKKKVKSEPPQICRQTLVRDGGKHQTQQHQNHQTQPKRKDSNKGKEAQQQQEAQVSDSASSVGSKLRKGPPEIKDSPLVAASLGLNRIKTRSGPLPQESFLGYRAGADKGSAVLSISNLSRQAATADGCSTSSAAAEKSGGKKGAFGVGRKAAKENSLSSGWTDFGNNCDRMSMGSGGPSRDQSCNIQARPHVRNSGPSSERGKDALVLLCD